jgi:hypothetical protein
VLVAFRVIGFPVLALVEGGVQVQEVREETACGDLAGKLVEVVVNSSMLEAVSSRLEACSSAPLFHGVHRQGS